MASITKDDVSVALTPRDRHVFLGNKIASMPEISFGGGGEQYVTGGIPLPEIGIFGFKRQVDLMQIQQPVGDALVYRYDAENHKIKVYTDDNVEAKLAELAGDTELSETKLPALIVGE